MKYQLRSTILKSLLKNQDSPLLSWSQDIHIEGNVYTNFSSHHGKYIQDIIGNKNDDLDVYIPYDVVAELFKKLGRKKVEFVDLENVQGNEWELSVDGKVIEFFIQQYDHNHILKEQKMNELFKAEYKDVDNYYFSIPAMEKMLESLKPFSIKKLTSYSSPKSYSMVLDQHINSKTPILRSVFDNGEVYVLQVIAV